MNRWENRVALVTGASSGIGAAICRVLVKHGLKVVGCARRVEMIEELAQEMNKDAPSKAELISIKCDVADEAQVLAMFKQIKEKLGRIDICINNAGFSVEASNLVTGEYSAWKNMLDVNVLALCLCTQQAIQLMKELRIDDGQIIHISSLSAHRVATYGMGFYAGTKFMVKALGESLRQQLRAERSGIRVAMISPGLTETEIFQVHYGEAGSNFKSDIKKMAPDDIGEAVVYILSTPPHVDVNDILIRPTQQPN